MEGDNNMIKSFGSTIDLNKIEKEYKNTKDFENKELAEFDTFYRDRCIRKVSSQEGSRYIDIEVLLENLYKDILDGKIDKKGNESYYDYFSNILSRKVKKEVNKLNTTLNCFSSQDMDVKVFNQVKDIIFNDNVLYVNLKGLKSQVEIKPENRKYIKSYRQVLKNSGSHIYDSTIGSFSSNSSLLDRTGEQFRMFAEHKNVVYEQQWELDLDNKQVNVIVNKVADKGEKDTVTIFIYDAQELVYASRFLLEEFTDNFTDFEGDR